VVIVGAGAAGLAAAHELADVGVLAQVLERAATVGSSWRTRHEDLRLNTVRWLSELPGAPMPRRFGRWVKRDDYVAYLEAYVRSNRIRIEHGVEVIRLERTGTMWRAHTSSGVYCARHVVIATGPDRVPWSPHWPGMVLFGGTIRHVATVPAAREFTHRDVLVVGGGNSGVEWAELLVRHGARRVWLSVRRPPNLVPREVGGLPLHPAAVALESLPTGLRDACARVVQHLTIGDLTPFGLPFPAEGPYRTLADTGVTVAIDTGFAEYVRQGRIRVLPEISAFTPRDVVFTDGSRASPDVVLIATGYRTGLEPMVGHLGVLRPNGRPRTRDVGQSAKRGLWFIGFTTAIEGTLRRHAAEARRIAAEIRRDLASRPADDRAAGHRLALGARPSFAFPTHSRARHEPDRTHSGPGRVSKRPRAHTCGGHGHPS